MAHFQIRVLENLKVIQVTFRIKSERLKVGISFIAGQQSQVSSKLDFSDTEDKDNSTVPVIKQGRSEDRNNEKNKEADTAADRDSTKSGPKIHGVRVTVDTGDGQSSKGLANEIINEKSP